VNIVTAKGVQIFSKQIIIVKNAWSGRTFKMPTLQQ
jgi:hypothetical protein